MPLSTGLMQSNISYIQEAMNAAGGFRGDPLFYFVVVGLLSVVTALSIVVSYMYKRNTELQENIVGLSKTGTEAISALMPIVQGLREDQKESLRRFEQQVASVSTEIKQHINLLKGIHG